MMLSFWLPALLLLLIALAFVLVPFVRYRQQASKLSVSSDWYRNREQELQQELAAGLFSEQEYQRALTELKTTAKGELSQAAAESNQAHVKEQGSDKKLVYLAAAVSIVLTAGFYGVNGLYQAQQEKNSILSQMPSLSQKIIQGTSEQVSPQELVHFALGLRTKLAEKEDPIGWMLLGRVYLSLNDVESAIAAFRKSYGMNRQNVSNTVSFAQALMYRGQEWELQESLTMLQEALMFQPDNVQALMLFAEANLMLEQFENAQRVFEMALKLLPADDGRIASVQQRLSMLAQQLGQNSDQSPVLLTVNIALANNISLDLSQFSHLFLFAKSATMPMPIAVKKVPVTALPMVLTLSDDDIMLPEQKLSQFDKVTLFARLSKDESAEFSAGEWQGVVSSVATSATNIINLEIDKEK